MLVDKLVSDPPNTCFRERVFDLWLERTANSTSLVTLMCWKRLGWQGAAMQGHLRCV